MLYNILYMFKVFLLQGDRIMIGFVDAGGGQRGIYASGIYDRLIDEGVKPEYCIGVSAGSGNLITFVSGQKERTKRFYSVYNLKKTCMGPLAMLTKGSYIDLNRIYSKISNSNGIDPLDYKALAETECIYKAVATDAKTGEPVYFTLDDFAQDDYTALKASCAMPLACRRVKFNGNKYFDGGPSDPIPFKKAFADGCDKVIVILTLPKDFRKKKIAADAFLFFRWKYPKASRKLLDYHMLYNKQIEELIELEKLGKALIVTPKETFGINTVTTNNPEGLEKLYQAGYNDGEQILDFLKATAAK